MKMPALIRDRYTYFWGSSVYVISYPKSGRTWLRILLGKYLSLKYNNPENRILSTEYMTRKSGLPSVSFSHDGSGLAGRRKYHNLSHNKAKYGNKKVILLGRNIKDTLVSAYFQVKKRINIFKGTVSEFIRTEEFGILKIIEFYNIWLQNLYTPKSLLFIRYEDLHQDPKDALKKILGFIGEVDFEEELLNY